MGIDTKQYLVVVAVALVSGGVVGGVVLFVCLFVCLFV